MKAKARRLVQATNPKENDYGEPGGDMTFHVEGFTNTKP